MQRFTRLFVGLLIGMVALGACLGTPTAIVAQERDGDRPRADRLRRPELEARLAEREQQVAALKKMLTQLKDGEDDRAAQIKSQLDRVVGEITRIRAELKGARDDRERPDVTDKRPNREQLVARLEKLRDRIAAAAKEGRHDEAEKLERQARDLKAMLEKPAADSGPRRDRDQPPASAARDIDPARRARHLLTAAKNLHAAGMPDLAEKLQRQAEELAAHARPDKRPREAAPEARRDKGPRPEGLLAELAHEIKALRREVDELRGQIKRLQGDRGQPR
jgi:hypothetical protein